MVLTCVNEQPSFSLHYRPEQFAGQRINSPECTMRAHLDTAIAPDAFIIIEINSLAFALYCFCRTMLPPFAAQYTSSRAGLRPLDKLLSQRTVQPLRTEE